MKKLKLLLFAIPFILFSSCSKTDNPVDESMYYDQDENCGTPTQKIKSTCCDVDGRILVEPGKSYNYTYKINEKLTPKNINWTVVSGDIKLVNGQGTDTATFSFGKNFTTGKISGIGNTGEFTDINCCDCQSFIDISKL
jgi:hypothetical protein